MQVTLSEKSTILVETLTTETKDAAAVIEQALEGAVWVKDATEQGFQVIAAREEVVDDDRRWVVERFYPAQDLAAGEETVDVE